MCPLSSCWVMGHRVDCCLNFYDNWFGEHHACKPDEERRLHLMPSVPHYQFLVGNLNAHIPGCLLSLHPSPSLEFRPDFPGSP